jgi:hypothetical protein
MEEGMCEEGEEKTLRNANNIIVQKSIISQKIDSFV